MGVGDSHPEHLHLLDLPLDLQIIILDFVPLQDLPQFSRSCTQVNQLVNTFLEHKVTVKMLTSWDSFNTTNIGLLTEMEQLVAHIRKKEDIVTRVDLYRLVFVRPVRLGQAVRAKCGEQRISGNYRMGWSHPDFVNFGWDEKLGRKVVKLDKVRWLQLAFTWPMVEVGRYKVEVRMRLEKNFTWPHTKDQPTVWTVKFPGEEGEENSVMEVDREWWKQIWKKREVPVGGLVVEKEVLYKWVRVLFPLVEVGREGAVTVGVKDTKCTLWKGGLSFDFSELRRVG